MTDTDVAALARAAKVAARTLGSASTAAKDRALAGIAARLLAEAPQLVAENAKDLETAAARGLSDAMVDRLRLTPARLADMAAAVREVAALADPVGSMEDVRRRPNGLQVGRMRIPLGVIAMVYESRPNVTTDSAALCVKSGNAVILKGGSEAFHSNVALGRLCREALVEAGLPADAVQVVESTDRGAVLELVQQVGLIDLAIPRGGEALIRFVTENARVPVVQHYKGVCHLYVDDGADLEMAARVVTNAKVQRPGVCNALETLLVHRAVAPAFLGALVPALGARGVEVRGCPATVALAAGAVPANDEDWAAEYLDLILAVRVVDGLDAAIDHIQRWGSEHTDGILSRDYDRIRTFVERVHSSAVVVNASTRFNDGNQLGLGAEIGISTSKLHAFGPMGLTELTTRKFVVFGEGQVRE